MGLQCVSTSMTKLHFQITTSTYFIFFLLTDESEVVDLCGRHTHYDLDGTKESKRKMYPWWAYIVVQVSSVSALKSDSKSCWELTLIKLNSFIFPIFKPSEGKEKGMPGISCDQKVCSDSCTLLHIRRRGTSRESGDWWCKWQMYVYELYISVLTLLFILFV